ncbi:hypothetical protein Tco_0137000 [Tanacetum coccineum]
MSKTMSNLELYTNTYAHFMIACRAFKPAIRWSIKDQVQDLERPVTYEEVKMAVWDCGTNKSPGRDGFSFEFYRKYWTTIDDDVFQAVRDFFVNLIL